PADAFIIAVPTPVSEDRSPDLTAVRLACRSIVPHLRKGTLVVLESTVPPGTTVGLVASILEESGLRMGQDFLLAYCPERVLPGNALEELRRNDRVIGGVDQVSAEAARRLYATFVAGTLHLTDATTAEVVKLAENTYRDLNIALANELALVCERLGLDAWQVIKLANHHPRVQLHWPGPGVGGHCIPVDPWFLVAAGPELMRLVRMGREVNESQPLIVCQKALELAGDSRGVRVAVLGVAYKADVADARETPALPLIEGLEQAGAIVVAHDPLVRTFSRPLEPLEVALTGADVAVLMTDHAQYRELDPLRIAPLMRQRRILDTRHCLDVARWQAAGFTVVQLGVGDRLT
ncbi:MAG: nucleotide sugar dehydrogenase, partial [Chloroflexi bacterium]|nr:nucleotide sugar dehydrogenase [Chloroflexota bacterium]